MVGTDVSMEDVLLSKALKEAVMVSGDIVVAVWGTDPAEVSLETVVVSEAALAALVV